MIGALPFQRVAPMAYRGFPPPRAAPVPYRAPVLYRPSTYGTMPGFAERERQRQAELQLQQQRLQLQQQRLQFQQQQFAQQQSAFVPPPAMTVMPTPAPQAAVSPAAPETDLTPTQDAHEAAASANDKPVHGGHTKVFLFAGIAVVAGVVGYMALKKKKP